MKKYNVYVIEVKLLSVQVDYYNYTICYINPMITTKKTPIKIYEGNQKGNKACHKINK